MGDSMDTQSETALLQAYSLIESGKFEEAKTELEDALTADLDNRNLVFGVHCCTFWIEVQASLLSADFFEQGETLVNQWKRFMLVVGREKQPLENTIYAFKKSVFSQALELYRSQFDDTNNEIKAEIYRKTGLCYKKLGSYESALGCLTEANELLRGNAAILAEMADCYALCGEEKRAKVLFREAFFVDAEKIDLNFLDSPLITLLVEQVQAKGYTGVILQEWIPVYGVLLGVFTVKRELRSQEVGKLKQEIYARENELKDPANDSAVITPRLLNLYFWLIDHYVITKESVTKINEVLLKIKIQDSAVYKLYVK
jgi:tetratricopeptide (TPR) repeat protein